MMRKPILCLLLCSAIISAKNPRELSFDFAVTQALQQSYKIKRLELDIRSKALWLEANRSSLLTKVYMNASLPDFRTISEYKWNSELARDVLVPRSTVLLQNELIIRQPIILFGLPTNGYVSGNSKLNEYLQLTSNQKTYYNSWYLKLEQPFFLPNKLKNDLDIAQLNFEDTRLQYATERVNIINETANSFFWVFDMAFTRQSFASQITSLKQIRQIIAQNSNRLKFDSMQIELELATAQENLYDVQGRLRQELANTQQRLRLDPLDSLFLTADPTIRPLSIGLDDVLQKASSNNPGLTRQMIQKKRLEFDYINEKARNAFFLKAEATYGLESSDSLFADMWQWTKYRNNRTVALNAYVPIWDWGERSKRMAASKLGLDRIDLEIAEQKENLEKNIRTAMENFNQNRDRFVSLQDKVSMAAMLTDASIQNYRLGLMSMSDLLGIINRQRDIVGKLCQAFLGYRRALMALMTYAFFDFEKNVGLADVTAELKAKGLY